MASAEKRQGDGSYEVGENTNGRNADACGSVDFAKRVRRFGREHRDGYRIAADRYGDRRNGGDLYVDRGRFHDDDFHLGLYLRVHAVADNAKSQSFASKRGNVHVRPEGVGAE